MISLARRLSRRSVRREPLAEADRSDGDLLRSHFDGDDEALAILLDRHAPAMRAAARRKVDVATDAEDAVQTAVAALLRQGRTLRGDASLGGWLHCATVRAAGKMNRRRLRQQARHRRLRELRPRDADPPPIEQITREADLTVLDEELAALPERHREPLVLKYLSGLSTAETATRLGVSIAATESRLRRARSLLRSRLARRGVSLGVLIAASQATVATASASTEPLIAAAADPAAGAALSAHDVPALPSSGSPMLSSLAPIKLTAAAVGLLLLPGSDGPPDGHDKRPIRVASATADAPALDTAIADAPPVAEPVLVAGGAAEEDGQTPDAAAAPLPTIRIESQSLWLDPKAGVAFQEGAGIGASMKVEGGAIRVLSVDDDGPAAAAGLKAGDSIITVGAVEARWLKPDVELGAVFARLAPMDGGVSISALDGQTNEVKSLEVVPRFRMPPTPLASVRMFGGDASQLLSTGPNFIGPNFDPAKILQMRPADPDSKVLVPNEANTPSREGNWIGAKLIRQPYHIDVQSVEPGGPAAEAGLKPGDQITSVSGVLATWLKPAADLSVVMAMAAPQGGSGTVPLGVRDPETRQQRLVLVKPTAHASIERSGGTFVQMPDGRIMPKKELEKTLQARQPQRAAWREAAMKRYRLGVGYAVIDEGFRVIDVLPGSPADTVGMQPGDVIRQVGDRSLGESGLPQAARSQEDQQKWFGELLTSLRDEDGRVLLTVRRTLGEDEEYDMEFRPALVDPPAESVDAAGESGDEADGSSDAVAQSKPADTLTPEQRRLRDALKAAFAKVKLEPQEASFEKEGVIFISATGPRPPADPKTRQAFSKERGQILRAEMTKLGYLLRNTSHLPDGEVRTLLDPVANRVKGQGDKVRADELRKAFREWGTSLDNAKPAGVGMPKGPRPEGPAKARADAVETALAAPISGTMTAVPLADAIAQIGGDVRLDRDALAKAGVAADTPVTLTFDGPRESVLRQIAESLPGEAALTVLDGAPTLTTADIAARRTRATRVYQIPESFAGQDREFAALIEEHALWDTLSSEADRSARVRSRVTPSPVGLIISTDWAGHREVERFYRTIE